ncbi:MAE_28990/MAE_18760 family HEPN-like nuclease [Alkalihalophilus marmarensis]|uniref:RiboL-PSP-HEPN domain-containing protein n=1 Tax=Alkalihalophilus marmarensis DSM 21297 TaxID=1188261 RepID=U6SJR9_9BACI|nr:MAE_28990/MAE_18760 family HEPN-like nuclease [Alkalihalophilus marmarensis]ERN51637.1 hypothetical protein A33I_20095 [Alkalihalophilus marmarensis DSM 21297]
MNYEELQIKLDKSSSFRKKEIGNLSSQINSVEGEIQRALLRSSFILLYSHFEGFTKESIRLYLKHINSRNIPIKNVGYYLQTLFHTKKIIDVRKSNRKIKYNELITAMLLEDTVLFKVDELDGDIVSTEGNLKFSVIEDLLFLLGFTIDEFNLKSNDKSLRTKEQFINRNIVKVRNQIAHGENIPVTLLQYNEVESFIIDFINTLSEEIAQVCSNKLYLIPDHAS